MSIFLQGTGIYLRAPDSGVEASIAKAPEGGFSWVALNLEYEPVKWNEIEARARGAGMKVVVWRYLRSDLELIELCQDAERYDGVILNLEKEFDEGKNGLTEENVLEASDGLDACISTEPWVFSSIDWNMLGDFPIHLQLFPQENANSHRPRVCRMHAYAMGCKNVTFMHGIHDLLPRDFVLQAPYAIYTGDDIRAPDGVHRDWPAWQAQQFHPGPMVFPFTGPLYGPSHRKGPMKRKSVVGLKMAMHEMGFEDFSTPDLHYNRKLEIAMQRFQRLSGIQATGQYGRASYEALKVALAADPAAHPAVGPDAAIWFFRDEEQE